jgi:hypothetical protein
MPNFESFKHREVLKGEYNTKYPPTK